MFVDASALVAIVTEESDAVALVNRLDEAVSRITSPLAMFQAISAVARKGSLSLDEASALVSEFAARRSIVVEPIPPDVLPLAVAAFARYGKGRRHPAQLNMGDCFAYACARHFRMPLLYKGDDFAHTDIDAAIRGR